MQNPIDLNDLLVTHPSATFLFDVSGDSMVDAFIPPKCRVIVDRSVAPNNNDIVLACVDGEYTVKRLFMNPMRVELHACNHKKKYPAIIFKEDMQLEIFGVVTAILTNPREVGL